MDTKQSQKPSGKNNTSSKRASNKAWQHVAIFIIALVISFPIYSSNAMATSLKVTSNAGEAGVEGYLNAESDTWNLEVEITNIDDDLGIGPEQVVLDVSGQEIEFNSCSGDSSSTTCEFQSILTDGISEDNYPFTVRLYDLIVDSTDETITEFGDELASDTDSIIADGSEPSITFNSIEQDGEEVILDFEVDDLPSGQCVGLDTIEIIDSDSGSILETISLGEVAECNYDYASDSDRNTESETAGALAATLTGEDRRYIKIRATDLLGNSETTAAKSFDSDFVAPDIDTSSLTLLDFGDYVGSFKQESDITLNITECSELTSVTAVSDYIEFYSSEASCQIHESDECVYECSWDDLDVTPSGNTVTASVTAIDELGNSETSTVSSSFETDTTSPSIVYFGSIYTYDDLSYLAQGESATIYLYLSESGSGVDEDTVKANLFSIGGSESIAPTICEEDSTGTADIVCSWDITNTGGTDDSSSTREISVTVLKDKVGNSGDLQSQTVVLDGVAPIVKEIEFYGFSAAGEKSFFQSNDDLIVKTQIQEGSGLAVYADVSDIVMDSATTYQYGETDSETGEYTASDWDGHAFFDESSCTRDSETGLWDCEFTIESIKSGYDGSADLELYVMDTAQNEAEIWPSSDSDAQNVASGSAGDYDLEIFGLDEETLPDFWQQLSANSGDDFIDLDIAELTFERISFEVKLSSSVDARASLIELSECAASTDDEESSSNSPGIYRSLLLGGQSLEPQSNPNMDILIEFEPFDANTIVDTSKLSVFDSFEKKELEYVCSLRIYSIIDETALVHSEDQEIVLSIPFRFSHQGSLDENIDALISDHVNRAGFKLVNAADKIARVVKYVQLVFTFVKVIYSFWQIIDFFTETLPNAPAGQTACYTGGAMQQFSKPILNILFNTMNVFFCEPAISGTDPFLSSWQHGVLEYYKFIKGEYILSNLAAGSLFGIEGDGLNNIRGEKNSDGSYDVVGDYGSDEERAKAVFLSTAFNTNSLYDNIWVSAIGLCPAGVVYNLQKLRQVHCSKLACLQNEVPNGVATIESCQDRYEYGVCKYFLGELLFLIPGVNILTSLGDMINKFVTDPVGDLFALTTLLCLPSCSYSPRAKTICNKIQIFVDVLQSINSVANAIKSVPGIQYDQCAAAGIDIKAYQEGPSAGASSTVTSDQASVATAG